jgi:hypothetical protein
VRNFYKPDTIRVGQGGLGAGLGGVFGKDLDKFTIAFAESIIKAFRRTGQKVEIDE